jgi:hypothetical protein
MGVEIALLVLAGCALAFCVRKSAAKFHSPALTAAVWAGIAFGTALLGLWVYVLSEK